MKKVLGLILAAVILLSALPAAAIAEEPETTATVTEVNEKGQKGTIVNCKTAVNVRAKASSKSKSLGKAKKGETVRMCPLKRGLKILGALVSVISCRVTFSSSIARSARASRNR